MCKIDPILTVMLNDQNATVDEDIVEQQQRMICRNSKGGQAVSHS